VFRRQTKTSKLFFLKVLNRSNKKDWIKRLKKIVHCIEVITKNIFSTIIILKKNYYSEINMVTKRDAGKRQIGLSNFNESQLIVIKTITCYRDERRLIK